MNADYVVKNLAQPDMSSAGFVGVLKAAGSPVSAAEAEAVYAYCAARRFSVLMLLAMFQHESGYGKNGWSAKTHSWGNTRPPSYGIPDIGSYDQDSAIFYPKGSVPPVGRRYLSAYDNWASGGVATVARFFFHPAYANVDSVAGIIPIWAPSSENDTAGYVAKVLAAMATYPAAAATPSSGGATMGHVPPPPLTKHPITKVIGVGRDPDLQRSPKFTVLHSMAGTLHGTDSYFPQPGVEALTDFGVGQVDQGHGYAEIIQWNDPFGSQIGWASGPVKVPEGDGPACLAAFGGAAGLNRYGVSIEHDDTTRPDGSTGQVASAPVSAAQWSATCWLQAYIHAEWLGQTAATFQWNMWHREFCGSAYKTCPGARFTDHADEYQNAIKAIMRYWQEGLPYSPLGTTVAGMTLTTPTQDGAPPPPPPPTHVDTARVRWYLNDAKEPVAEIVFGGQAKSIKSIDFADIGIEVVGMDDATYQRSLQRGVFLPYEREG